LRLSEDWTDPGSLEGDALTQWYLRSPADIERGRQTAAARRYQDFFYGGAAADPAFGRGVPASSQDIDPGFSIPGPSKDIDPGFAVPAPSGDIDPGFTWAQVGPNRWRSVRTDEQSTSPSLPATSFDNNAGPTDGALRSNVSYRAPASASSLDNGFRQAAGRQPAPPSQIDPSKTPVFQTGPDGKLHPIPGWHTTGPFDFGTWSHNIHWGGVAKDLGEIGAGVASFFSGVGLGGEMLSALGPEAETAVAEGIAESPAAKAAADAIHSHHVDPKYMGGAANGERVDLVDELHRRFHSMLGKAHREAGFPPVGGKSGSKIKWDEHFDRYPESREEAMQILRRVSREFDETYGTNISSKLSPTPSAPEVGVPPPD
jgi:hypothetical protein